MMSRELVALVDRRDPSDISTDLDDEVSTISPDAPISVTRGPFSVYRATGTMSSPDISAVADQFASTGLLQPDVPVDEDLEAVEHFRPIFEQDSAETLGLLDDVGLSMFNTSPVSSQSLDPYITGFEIAGTNGRDTPRLYFPQYSRLSSPGLTIVPHFKNRAPRDAWFLLSHYRDTIIPILSPLKYSKTSPWKVLHLPGAMNALAEMTMGSRGNHARTAFLYAILATSAFGLLRSSSAGTEHWQELGNLYQTLAQQELKLSLSQETTKSGPKRAKYKEILLATLSMATVSVSQPNVVVTLI